jgi:hypothetical protein
MLKLTMSFRMTDKAASSSAGGEGRRDRLSAAKSLSKIWR